MRLALIHAAAAVDGGSLDIATVLQYGNYGIGGVFLLLLMAGKWVVPEYVLRRAEAQLEEMRAERDKAYEQLARLQTVMDDKVLPIIIQAQATNARYVDELARRTPGGGHAVNP